MQLYTDSVFSPRGAVRGASVAVRDKNGVLAVLYADNGVTTKPNPTVTDANGVFSFYAADGEYTLTVSGAGFTPHTSVIVIADVNNPSSSTVSLTDGSTINWDMEKGHFAFLTLSTTQGSRTLANPTNITPGLRALVVTQGSSGGQDITAYGDAFVGSSSVSISKTAGAVTVLWFVSDGTRLICTTGGSVSSPVSAPSPASPGIAVADEATDVLLVGNHIVHSNVWNAVGLTRGTYTGLNGTTYEQQIGVVYPPNGAQDPVGLRIKWAFPTGSTEVKSYPAIITGNFPGWYQPNTPKIAGTWNLRKQDGTYSTSTPSGKTPNSFFPIAFPVIGNLQAHGSWVHNATPTGRGHLSWDIWLQSSASQTTGFTVPPIHTEVMIPLTFWGEYGAYKAGGGGRNPDWYWGDDTIDGQTWHIFQTCTTTRKDGSTKGNNFNGLWNFIVLEPDSPTALPTGYQPNIALVLNYLKSKGWLDVAAPANPNPATHVVSAELGVECIDGTGDLTIYNFDVTNT